MTSFLREELMESVTQKEEGVIRANGHGVFVVGRVGVDTEEKAWGANESPKRSRDGEKLAASCGGVVECFSEKIEEKDDAGDEGFFLHAGHEFSVQKGEGFFRREVPLAALPKEEAKGGDLERRSESVSHHVQKTPLEETPVLGPSIVEEVAADVLHREKAGAHRGGFLSCVVRWKKLALEYSCYTKISFECLVVTLQFFFKPNGRGTFLQYLQALCLPNWLEKIMVYPQADELEKVFRVTVGGGDNDDALPVDPAKVFHERNAVHDGHADVRHDRIGASRLKNGKPFLAVGGGVQFPHESAEHLHYVQANECLVFHIE